MSQIDDKLKLLPTSPGVYVMLDDKGQIIYVGKAKNLKNRVRQYFFNTEKTEKDGAEKEVAADTVIISAGLKPRAQTVDSLWNCAPNFRPIGDCSSPRFIADATGEGYFAALDIR